MLQDIVITSGVVSTTYNTISCIILECPPDSAIQTRKLKSNIVILDPKNPQDKRFQRESLIKRARGSPKSEGKRNEQEIPIGEITNDERTILITMSIQPLVENLE